MLVVLCSDKGSPGTTTTALALASAWPTPAVMVEADPFGGDVALRLRTDSGNLLPETPTVLTLATAARTCAGDELLHRYPQRINDQLSVVPGHLMAEQAMPVGDWEPLGARLAATGTPTFVDVGRLHAGSPLLPVAAAADVVMVVGRADTESIIRLRERLTRLVAALAATRDAPPRLFPVLVGTERHGPRDLRDLESLLEGTPARPLLVGLGHASWDLMGAARLWAGEPPTRRLARTALLRSARRTTDDLTTVLGLREREGVR